MTSRAFLLVLATAVACARSAYPPPPATRETPVVDTLHGVAIADPYRWLEDQQSEEVHRWIALQNAYADSILGDTPSRRRIAGRLRELMGAPNVGALRRAGDWEYFTLRRTGEEAAAIFRRKAPKEAQVIDPSQTYEKVLDPLTLRSDATTSIGIEGLSTNGDLLLYSVRDGGADEISVRVRDLRRGVDLPDSLPWALYGSLSFDPQNRGIYYVHRSRESGPRLKYHRFGTPVSADSVLLGDALAPTAFLTSACPRTAAGDSSRSATAGSATSYACTT